VVEETRLADTDHADAKGGNSAAAGADSKLVKSIMSRQAEQEAAVAATNKTNVEVSMRSCGLPFLAVCLLACNAVSAVGGRGKRLADRCRR
jgi:hypothetical protein